MNNNFDDDDEYDLVDDCAWITVLHIAEQLERSPEPLHQDFVKHLKMVSHALRAISKVEGGDCPEGTEVKPILAVLKPEDSHGSAEQSSERAQTTQDQI
jgi:hypothetical protein